MHEPWRFRTTTCDAIVVRKTWIGGEGICVLNFQVFMNSRPSRYKRLIGMYHVNVDNTLYIWKTERISSAAGSYVD